MNQKIIKRKLHENKDDRVNLSLMSIEARLDAVETINCLKEKKYAEQAFPRIFKVTRKTQS